MTRNLFCANQVFQGVLLHVRNLCERASSSKNGLGDEENSILMIKIDTNATYTLEEFNQFQDVQINSALQKLKALKEEVINLTYISCIVIFLNLTWFELKIKEFKFKRQWVNWKE